MPTLSLTLDGANGLAHNWNHVLTPLNEVVTWANTTKIDYLNVQTSGLRTSNIRAHAGSDHLREKIRNATGGTLSAGTLVYHSGSYDDGTDKYPSVSKAQAQTSAANTKYAVGIITADVSNGADGDISQSYELASLDTSGKTVHDPVFLGTTAGTYTYTEPTGGNAVQVVGRISKVDASDGRVVFSFPGTIEPFDFHTPFVIKYDAGEYVSHAVSSAGVYSITTTDASSDSGAITLDTVDSITLDSDTATEGVVYADGGTNLLRISNSSSDVIIKPLVDAKDIVFQQFDGNEVCRIADNRRLYFYDEGGEYISSSGSALTIASNGIAWELPTADGSANQYLKTDGSGNLDWVSPSAGLDAANGVNNRIATFSDADSLNGEANLLFDGSILGVNEDASSFITTGLTLNQGAADNTILEGKSSDVGHAMTAMTEADTFFDFQKRDGAGGGVRIRGFRDADAGAGGALVFQGVLGEAADTTTSTSATSVTEVGSVVTDGSTGAQGAANGGNAVGIYNASTCRFLVKGNGDLHGSDTSIASFDDMPDFIAARAYQTAHARQQGEGLLGGMEIHRPDLVCRMEEAGIVTPAELPGEGHIPGHRFMNLQKSIKFSWDMGFQLGSWMNEIVKVLTPKQKAKLPLQMREAFAELEEAA